jgi:hypothetical protein
LVASVATLYVVEKDLSERCDIFEQSNLSPFYIDTTLKLSYGHIRECNAIPEGVSGLLTLMRANADRST